MRGHRDGILAAEVSGVGVREDLHQLVDRLPDSEEAAARRFLEFLVERGGYDEEPLTQEEEVVLAQGLRDMQEGRVRPVDEVLPPPGGSSRSG
jgi:hypothetical protein